VDWIADYYGTLGDRKPVLSSVAPGDVLAALPAECPEAGEPWGTVMADLDRVVMPGVTNWQHPCFFGYYPANSSFPGMLGEFLSGALNGARPARAQGWPWRPPLSHVAAACPCETRPTPAYPPPPPVPACAPQ